MASEQRECTYRRGRSDLTAVGAYAIRSPDDSGNDIARGRSWAGRSPQIDSDWMYEGWLDASAEAQVVSVNVEVSDDQGFTSQHLAVAVELK